MGMELNSTGHLVINVTSLPSYPLYLTSSDINYTTTTQRVSILFCDCENNGTCIKDSSWLPLDRNGHYRLPCNCGTGFAGLYCEEDVRGCDQGPCPSFTTCELSSSSDSGYLCTNCAAGYVDEQDKCVGKFISYAVEHAMTFNVFNMINLYKYSLYIPLSEHMPFFFSRY